MTDLSGDRTPGAVHELDPGVLTQIMLVQSTLHATVSDRQLGEFLASGLSEVPGVQRIGVCLRGELLGWKGEPEPCSVCDCPISNGGERPACSDSDLVTACEKHGGALVRCLPLDTATQSLGCLIVQEDATGTFELYRPFVANLANQVALELENRRQSRDLDRIHQDLESRFSSTTQELRESEARFRDLVENLQEGIWTLDAEGHTTYVNPRMAEMLGYTVEEMLGRHLFSFMDERAVEAAKTNLARRAAGITEQHDFELVTKQGSTLYVSMATAPDLDADGVYSGATAAVMDMTALQRSREQLEQAQKMESIGRLAGGVAHDFNNLLTAIRGFAELTMERLHEQDPLAPDIREIIKAANSAASLTQQLLAFSRKQIVSPETLDLNSLVVHSQRMLDRLLGEDMELAVDLGDSLWPVHMDRGQVDQILVNLAVNARDAMPDGGRLVISTRNERISGETCRLCMVEMEGDFVSLAVVDTGTGMDADTLRLAFEPFFTTKADGLGTGLGLSTIHGISHQHQGHVRARSAPGVGTTLEILLPRAKGRGTKRPVTGVGVRERASETVLLVEDMEMVRDLTQRILERDGYRVLSAQNGDEAMALAEKHFSAIDLMLTDVVLPKTTGTLLSTRIVNTLGPLRVLYMSGYPEDAVARRGVLNTEMHFIQKPFSPKQLLRQVRQTLDASLEKEPST